jgi:hemoglobin
MTRTRAVEHRGRDLDTVEEVAEFVTRFYREIAQDAGFHHYFETLAHVDWHAHTLTLTDFWAGLLFGTPHQPGDEVIEAHRWLHEATPFDAELFDRWLEILDSTLSGGWRGPFADHASRRGHGLAWAMQRRLVGPASGPALAEGDPVEDPEVAPGEAPTTVDPPVGVVVMPGDRDGLASVDHPDLDTAAPGGLVAGDLDDVVLDVGLGGDAPGGSDVEGG